MEPNTTETMNTEIDKQPSPALPTPGLEPEVLTLRDLIAPLLWELECRARCCSDITMDDERDLPWRQGEVELLVSQGRRKPPLPGQILLLLEAYGEDGPGPLRFTLRAGPLGYWIKNVSVAPGRWMPAHFRWMVEHLRLVCQEMRYGEARVRRKRNRSRR
jgi:hypothetical protein